MNKFLSISLLIILFISQVGYYFIYTIRQEITREEMEQKILSGLPGSMLERIPESSAIVWEEEGKEFMLAGQRYDVARIENEGGVPMIYCVNDAREQSLMNELAIAAGDKGNGKQDTTKNLLKFHQQDIIADIVHSPDFPTAYTKLQYTEFVVPLRKLTKDIQLPPPRFS